MRTLSAPLKEALRSSIIRPAVLVEIIVPDSPTIRAWSGTETLTYGGVQWLGAGLVMGIAPVESTAAMAIRDVSFTLSGVRPEDLLAAEIDEVDVKAWIINVYWCALTEDRRVIPDAILILRARGDTLSDKPAADGSIALVLTGQAGFWNLERAQLVAWTSEEQQRIYPDDTGFDLIPGYMSKDLAWTRT